LKISQDAEVFRIRGIEGVQSAGVLPIGAIITDDQEPVGDKWHGVAHSCAPPTAGTDPLIVIRMQLCVMLFSIGGRP